MIRISQLKLPAGHSKTELYHKAAKALHIKSEQIASLQIRRQSIDARKKPDIFLIYVVDITLNGISEQNCVSRSKNKDVSIVTERPYQFPKPGTKALRRRPVIIGSGPAGLFCCYMLAQNGYRPILLERGKDVEARKKDVEAFWNGGPLNPESNVSFGEGGAGTFSDGKLNTLIKDKRRTWQTCPFDFCRKRRAAGNSLRCKAAYRDRCSVQCRKTDAGKNHTARRRSPF